MESVRLLMADLWHPRARRNPAASNLWGTYVGGPFRGVLHTTETEWYHSTGAVPSPVYDGYGHNSFPHSTIVPEGNECVIYQHIPINRAARALVNAAGGVQTNNDSAVQCEIVWRAANAPNMPKALLDAVADWMRWVESAVGVKRRAVKFPSPRMTGPQWDAFDGWCGHMHVPENSHVDPGAIDIDYLLGTDSTEEEDEMALMLSADGKPGVLLRTGSLITGVADPQSFYAYAAAGVPAVKVSGAEWDRNNGLRK